MPGKSLIGNLAVNLTLESAAFQRGATIAEKRVEGMRSKFAAATKSVSGFGAALGVGIGVAALTNVVRSSFEMAAALEESAQKVGITVEALQELNLAAEQSGVSQEQLAVALGRLNKSLGELQLGKKGAVDAFAQIGLAADDLKGKSADQALRIIADALNKLPDVQQRVAIGSQLMGRSFSQLLPLINGGSKALDDYAKKSRQAGQISTEDAKKLDELSDTWERAKVRIGVSVANIIARVATFAEKIDGFLRGLDSWAKSVDAAIANLASSAVNSINKMVSGISQAINGRLNAVWEGAKSKIQSVIDKFKSMWDKVVGHSYVPDMVDEIGAQMARLDAVLVQPVTDATSKAAEAFRNLQAQTAGLLDRLFPEAAALNTLKSEMATLEEAMKRGILTADQYAAALQRLQTEGLSDEPISVLDQGPLVGDNESVGTGLGTILDQMPTLIDRTQAWRDVIGQVATDLAGIAGDWLSRFVEGTVKLKDLFKQLAVYAIQFLMSPNSPLKSLFGGARAAGGPVARGKAYLVGENGPELFSPGTSGRVIANDDMAWQGGGRSGGQTFNIYTNDADSFRRNERQIARDGRRRLNLG